MLYSSDMKLGQRIGVLILCFLLGALIGYVVLPSDFEIFGSSGDAWWYLGWLGVLVGGLLLGLFDKKTKP